MSNFRIHLLWLKENDFPIKLSVDDIKKEKSDRLEIELINYQNENLKLVNDIINSIPKQENKEIDEKLTTFKNSLNIQYLGDKPLLFHNTNILVPINFLKDEQVSLTMTKELNFCSGCCPDNCNKCCYDCNRWIREKTHILTFFGTIMGLILYLIFGILGCN
jgi:hypothetical protein